MNSQDPDILARALWKQKAGYGTSNSEKRAMSDFAKGKIGRDHFSKIEVRPPSARPEPLLETPRTLADRIHTISTPPVPLPTPTFTVADLIASGATFEEFTICDSGSPATRWMPTWTADPTP